MKTIIFFLMIIGSVLIFTGLLELEFNRKKCKNVSIELFLEIFMTVLKVIMNYKMNLILCLMLMM